MKPMSHYDFRCLVFLANIDPKTFGGHNHLVSAVQRRAIRGKDGSIPTTTVSAQKAKENRRQEEYGYGAFHINHKCCI